MSSERRLKRIRKRRQRNIALLIIFAICLLGYFAVNNQFIKGLYYKVGEPISDNNPVMEFEDGVHADYRVFNNMIISSSKNGIYAYNLDMDKVDEKHFEELSSVVANYNNMKIKAGRKNIAVYDKNGRDAVVFNNKKILSNVKLNSSIILAKPLENGGMLVIAEDTSAKNQVVVYNNSGKEEFIWHSGVNNIIDASYIEDDGILAVAVADLSTGVINSKISFFDISSANPKSEITLEDVFVTNTEFIGSTLLALSDKGLYYISDDGEIKNTYSYNEKMLSNFKITEDKYVVLSFNGNGTESITDIVNKKGKCIGSFNSENEIIYIDSFNGNILLCNRRGVSIISKKGFLMRNISYSKDLNKAFFIGRNKVVLLGNSEIRIVN